MSATNPRQGRGLVAKGPQRRQAIARAAARILRLAGIEGVTHRAVADEAGVPLGSTTYYFSSRDELLEAATECVVEESVNWFEGWASEVEPDSFDDELPRMMYDYMTTRRDEAVTDVELFVLAARRPELRVHTSKWSTSTAAVLNKFVAEEIAERLAIAMHGITLVSIASDRTLSLDEVRRMLGFATD